MQKRTFSKNERKYWAGRFSGEMGIGDSSYEKRDLINLMEYNREELDALLAFAGRMKSGNDTMEYLAKKTVGLMFGVASTRTRISFQVGTRQLGGHADFYNTKDLQLVYHESLIDTIRVMSRYIDALVVRLYDMNQYGKGRESMEQLVRKTVFTFKKRLWRD